MSVEKREAVCVTDGSGYIGSWLVRLLLDRGYTVHATVRDLASFPLPPIPSSIPKDEKETKHLLALEGADARLSLFPIDLLDYGSVLAAVTETVGVFHVASPCTVDEIKNPEEEVLGPAVTGTKHVLTAAKEVGVKRVVVTSSISAITQSPHWPADVSKREDCWTDVDYCKQKGLWYPLSKTLAEKEAWEFAEKNGLDVVTVNPGTVLGPIIPPAINASMLVLLRLLQGSTEEYPDFYMGPVHVKDVALAHILVLPRDTQPGLLRDNNGARKLMDLGLHFIPLEQIIKDGVESLMSRGFIS
ncbi:Phenylacetaldehyde reductase-like protein [Drosera capensis]